MGGGGLRVVERNGRVAGVLWCVFHVLQWSGWPGPEREDQDAAPARCGRGERRNPNRCVFLRVLRYRKSEIGDSVVPRHVPITS
jgi:hypothetical protein